MTSPEATAPDSRAFGFWHSVMNQDRLGFRLIVGLIIFPVILGLYAVAAKRRSSLPLWVGLVVAASGWLVAWCIVVMAFRRRRDDELPDLTPAGPLALPVLAMLGGVIAPLATL